MVDEPELTNDRRVKLTTVETDMLQSLLDAHDRGGFYMAYNAMTDSAEASLQSRIATFSGLVGGAALVANRFGQVDASGYPGIYVLSQLVAESALTAIKDANDASAGKITDEAFFNSARDAWVDSTFIDYFPGNLLIGTTNNISSMAQALLGQLYLAWVPYENVTANGDDIRAVTRKAFDNFKALLTPGAWASFRATLIAYYFGKSAGDMSGYTKIAGPGDHDIYVDENGHVGATFNSDGNDALVALSGGIIAATLNTFMQLADPLGNLVDIVTGSSLVSEIAREWALEVQPTAFGPVVPSHFSEFYTGGFNGDTHAPPPITNSDPDRPVWREAATGGADILYASDAAVDGGGGKDVLFGNEDENTLIGGADDDIIWGRAGEDKLDGGAGDDILRGGADGDRLKGGAGDDILDGGDINTPAADDKGMDIADGGAGNDYIYGGGGTDKLIGGEGQDSIFGGQGDDILIGGNEKAVNEDKAVIEGSGSDQTGDKLYGGKGDDTYYVSKNDIIDDRSKDDGDGKGRVYADRDLLTGGKKEDKGGGSSASEDTVYVDSFENRYTVSGSTLTIQLKKSEGPLTINNWSNGDLGIWLKGPDIGGGGSGSVPPPQQSADPLVLDLDGNGVTTLSRDNSSAFFDVDKDGIAEHTAWVDAGDGILVLDRNGNGIVDDASETFGYTKTVSITPRGSAIPQAPGIGLDATSGFDQLSLLDTNQNRRIDAGDVDFNTLRVWKDLDQDGQSDENELFTLLELGIASIGTTSQREVSAIAGGWITDVGSFTKVDGTTGTVGDVWLNFDQQHTLDVEGEVGADVASLPDLARVGRVNDLRDAAQTDDILKAKIAAFAALTVNDASQISAMATDIMLRWHGANAQQFHGRGHFADGSNVAVYESITDTPFEQWRGNIARNPAALAADLMQAEVDLYLRNITAKLFAQSALGQILFPELSLIAGDFLSLEDGTLSTTVLSRLITFAPTDAFEKLAYWHSMLSVLDAVRSSFADVKSDANGTAEYVAVVETILTAQGIDLNYSSILHAYVRGDGDDKFATTSYSFIYTDTVEAGLPDQLLRRVVVGGEGDDEVKLGIRSNIIYWGEGQGNDVIVPTYHFALNFDVITSRADVRLLNLNQDDIELIGSVEPWSRDISIRIKSSGETLTLQYAMVAEGFLPFKFTFVDGTTQTLAQLVGALQIGSGTVSDDLIIRADGLLDGGAGDDILQGGAGDNIYHFGLGSGTDVVVERGVSNNDVVQFGSSVLLETVDISLVGEDLVFRIRGTDDVLTVEKQNVPGSNVIEQFIFGDGSSYTFQQILEIYIQRQANNGNTTIEGTFEDDVIVVGAGQQLVSAFDGEDDITGGKGNDILIGGYGADTYRYNLGDGNDFIVEQNELGAPNNDVLVFGQGISITDVTFEYVEPQIDYAGPEGGIPLEFIRGSWIVTIGTGTDAAKIEIAEYSDLNSEGIEVFRFEDGSEIYTSDIKAQLNIGTELDQRLFGTNGSDVIDAAGGNDFVSGSFGDDTLIGGTGDDVIAGGLGVDHLFGGEGSNSLQGGEGGDTYHVVSSTGIEMIFEEDRVEAIEPADTISLEAGLNFTDMSARFILKQASTSSDQRFGLELTFAGSGKTVIIDSSGYIGSLVENFAFADGTQKTDREIEAIANHSTSADDFLIGNEAYSADLNGGAGNDTIFIAGGNNKVIGGTGDDTVYTAYSGHNVYHYDVGDGSDTYFESIIIDTDATTQNEIEFGFGISANDIRAQFIVLNTNNFQGANSQTGFGSSVYALEISFDSLPGSITYAGLGFDNRLDLGLRFANGTRLTEAQIFDLANTSKATDQVMIGRSGGAILGGSGNDLVYGTSWYTLEAVIPEFRNDDITGGAGNDILAGNTGPDTYRYALGDGDDIIFDSLDTETGVFEAPAITPNRLILGPGIAPADIQAEIVRDIQVPQLLNGISASFGVKLTFGSLPGSITIIGNDSDPISTVGLIEFSDRPEFLTLSQLVNASNQPKLSDQIMIGNGSSNLIEGGGGNDQLYGFGGDDVLVGGEGSDVLFDLIGSNTLIGEQGNDTITAGYGQDTISGGEGDDTIVSNGGADTVLYGLGDGNDVVSSLTNGFIRFSDDLLQSAVTYSRVGVTGADLQVSVAGSGTILITGALNGNETSFGGFVFAGNVVISGDDIAQSLMLPTSGVDLIFGTEGDDVLDGQLGNDVLSGGGGNDTYMFNRTYGEDTFVDAGGLDVVSLGNAIIGEQLLFGRIGDDLLVEMDGRERASVTVKGQFGADGSQRVEIIRLSDGTEISASDIEEILLRESSSSSDDSITGFASSDVINAGAGNDIIYGAGGSDRIDGGAGWDIVELDGTADRYIVENRGDITAFIDNGVTGRTAVESRNNVSAFINNEVTARIILVRNVESVVYRDAEDPADRQVDLVNNTAPIAGAIQLNMREDGELRIQPSDLIANVTDAEDGSIQLVDTLNATGGTVKFDASGNIVFKSDANFSGSASFKYLVRDGGGLQSTGIVQIAVAPVNDKPVLALTLPSIAFDENTVASVTLPQNLFTDVDGDNITLSARLAGGEALPTWLSFDPASKTFSGTPPQDFNGVLQLEVVGSDGSLSEVSNFTLHVRPVNDAPIAVGTLQNQTATAGAAINFVVANSIFADVDDTVLDYTASLANGDSLPTWLSFNGTTGQFSGQSPQGFAGVLNLKVTASDGQYTAYQNFNLTVEGGNDAPVVDLPLADHVSDEDQSITVTVPIGTFTDADGDTLTFTANLADGSALPSWLVVNTTTGAIIGTAPANFNGSFTIKLTASDGVLSATDEFVLTVAHVNDAPVLSAVIPNVSADEDAFVSFALPANLFIDVDNSQLTLSVTLADGSTLPAWLVFDAVSGGFSGTPPLNFNGNVDVKVTASDGDLQTAGIFTLAITPINDAPILANALLAQSTAEDQPVSFTLPANAFSDVDGDVLSLSAKLSSGAALPAWLAFDAITLTFSGIPPLNFNGTVSIAVTASDGVSSATDTFAINITAVNDAPIIAVPLLDQSSFEDQSLSIGLPSSAFTDVDGDTLTYSATLASGAGLPSWLVVNAATGALSGTPPANFNGVLDVKLIASDGTASVSDVFTLTITAVNDAPVVSVLIPDTSSLEEQSVNFVIPANSFLDVDGNALTLTATLSNGDALPAWLSFNGTTGAFTGTPPQNFNGSLNVKVTASDGELSTFDSFTLAITPVNDVPVVAQLLADQQSVEDTAISFTLPVNAFSDVDNSILTYSATLASGATLPTWLSFNATTRQFSGIPPLNFFGALDVKVSVSDGTLAASDVFTLNVTPVNDAPVAVNDGPLAATFNNALTISAASLLANDSDVESATLSIASVQGGVNGSVALNAAGNVVFTPTTGFLGSASFTYTLNDGSGGTSSATVALSVSSGSNIINGTTGSNILFGTATNDLINARAGDDVVIAGDGNDTIYAGSGTDFVEAGSGNDVIYGEAGGDILYANDGDDIAYGGDGNDIVIGANGDDMIYGDLGNDNLSGDAGNDTLYGGAGVDTMYGGTGNDRLSGQAGNDTMSGETGSDTFVFAAGFGKDRITDFQAGTAVSDVIQLSLGANFDTFAEILAATTNVQGNAVITISPADTITIVGINKTALVDNDFLFT